MSCFLGTGFCMAVGLGWMVVEAPTATTACAPSSLHPVAQSRGAQSTNPHFLLPLKTI